MTKGVPSAAWARMTPVNVCARLMPRIEKRTMPAAEMISGTIIGDIRIPMIKAPRNGIVPAREQGRARSSVPEAGPATKVAQIAMSTELRIELARTCC